MTEKTEPNDQAAAWTVRVPATGKVLWAEARPECLDTWRQEWERDGFEVIPLYLHPSSSIERIKVRKIEWEPVYAGAVDLKSETIIGGYTLSFDAPTAGGAVNLWMAGAHVDDFDVFDTAKEAKAAAQADYERRILSALDLSPKPLEITEAARFLIDRLDDFERGSLGDTIEDACRDFDGHVYPAIERLRASLKED